MSRTGAEAAIARRALRQLRTAALVVGVTFGATAASAALTYVDSFPTEADRRAIAASLSGASGFSVLFGEVDRIGTVGGYTAYKSFVFLTTIGAVWAALAVTRVLRGEEDTGGWHLVLTGATTPRRATLATLGGVAAALAIVLVATTALIAAAGASSDVGFTLAGSVTFGLSSVLPAAVFAGVAAVCSQVAETRRLATTLAMAVLGVAFVLRMVGDANPASHWLLWTTPFGWAELMRPLTADVVLPLLPAGVLIAGLGLVAVELAARRDVGRGVLVTASARPPRAAGLGSSLGVATRLTAPVLGAWAIGTATTAFVFGIVAKPVADALADSAASSDVLVRLGIQGIGAVQYLGVVFLLVGAVLALVPASQISAARDEEASGRLALVLAGQPSRVAWLAGRLGLAAAAVSAIGIIGGVAAWAGARSQGLSIGLGTMLLAGLNIVPAALLALAGGAVVLAVLPRAAPMAVYLLVAWSLVVDLIGSLITSLSGLSRLSLFHYTALAPAEDPNAVTMGLTTAAAVAVAGIALLLFERRDLASA